jgi:hypothetical protein
MQEAIYRIIDDGKVMGTAFSVGSGIIVTAAHLISDTSACFAPNDEAIPISTTELFEADDLAVLITGSDLPSKLSLSRDSPPAMVTTFGYPPVPHLNGVWGIAAVLGKTAIDGRPRLPPRGSR